MNKDLFNAVEVAYNEDKVILLINKTNRNEYEISYKCSKLSFSIEDLKEEESQISYIAIFISKERREEAKGKYNVYDKLPIPSEGTYYNLGGYVIEPLNISDFSTLRTTY